MVERASADSRSVVRRRFSEPNQLSRVNERFRKSFDTKSFHNWHWPGFTGLDSERSAAPRAHDKILRCRIYAAAEHPGRIAVVRPPAPISNFWVCQRAGLELR